MQNEEKVKTYFGKQAKRFDSIYEKEKKFWQKIIDKLFRQVVKDRFNLTFNEITDLKGKTVLDVGCGSGRYALEFALRGAEKVWGIDYAFTMIELAKTYAENLKEERCQYICGDFINYDFKEKFDYTLAMGFFDYLKNPSTYLFKMKELTRQKIVASFSKKWKVRNLIRRTRLFLANCPVYFYSRKEIEKLLQENQLSQYKIFNLSRDFIVIAETGQSHKDLAVK